MDILSSQQGLDSEVVITLGTFDGVHLAHQKIIDYTVQRAQELNCASALFTFTSHPLSIVAPSKIPDKLTSLKQKKKIISSLGIETIIDQDFTLEFARLSYHDFIKKLNNYCTIKEIIVGQDFSCGYQGVGTPKKLAKLGEKKGFNVQVVPPIKIDNQEVGSTNIRKLIKSGNLVEVKQQLGRNFTLDAKVVKGDQRGREIGFPTANLEPVVSYALPPAGVYACQVKLSDKKYSGIVNIGLRPTFNKDELSIEVHLFDFNQNIYGVRLELELIEWIRSEKKYETSQELVAQIKKDVKQAKNILNYA
ncbi:riboflavin kinase/FMN adenylyltransferase [Halobacteroides halobius DSM 5150]|uniref:Riboflavin biosynthesis protein n=1 Tax=Halobacteroides halobius (strain ATCC 35273 / DSM 5150 / MD-1) TaxID=748449 RepID=L0K8I3_HALHC|nr:bifunctional riboflavin kinase/FAD synthetase [Halobacteroides halobius]AGB40679.1 riboflavin kinase/FMN adenylyltransferase [Halobacteroides halobius DSM 5150]